MKKCESNGVKYASYLCDFMQQAAKNGSPRSKAVGIIRYAIVDTWTGDSLGESIAYSKGKGEKVHLNFCPFCGGKLHSVDIGD